MTGPKLSPYELRRQQEEAHRRSDAARAAEMRKRAEATVAEAERQQAEAEHRQAIEAETKFKAEEKRKYLAAGGLEADFEPDWPRLRKEIIERRWAAMPTTTAATAGQRTLETLYRR